MDKKLIVGVAAGALALFALAWAAAPVFTAKALISAAKAGDERKLAQLVDFPVLRESMKDELEAELVSRMRRDCWSAPVPTMFTCWWSSAATAAWPGPSTRMSGASRAAASVNWKVRARS